MQIFGSLEACWVAGFFVKDTSSWDRDEFCMCIWQGSLIDVVGLFYQDLVNAMNATKTCTTSGVHRLYPHVAHLTRSLTKFW